MDVAVIGGGIVGLMSAYYLNERGASVTIFEKQSLGSGSTERSLGGIRSQYSTEVNVKLSKISKQVWNDFESIFGTDIAFRQVGYLFLARDQQTADDFQSNVEMQNRLGVPTKFLEPNEALTVCPQLNVEEYTAATYLESDGFADPHLALQGVSNTLATTPVDILTNSQVQSITTEGDRIIGLSTEDKSYTFDYIVNAAGPWAKQIAEMTNISIPITPKRRQSIVVDPEIAVDESIPLTIDLDNDVHFRPERDGKALIGGHVGDDPATDPDTYSRDFDLDWAETILNRANKCATYFGPQTRIRRGWAGLYAVTPDHHPIIDEIKPGFITAGGFSGHGFQHAPATGKIVADIIIDGGTSRVDLGLLSLDRFANNNLIEERNVA
ncbi:MAG: NAD(P)/FAD-dependent oxidoreductase [Halobacteriaceae archaeon]